MPLNDPILNAFPPAFKVGTGNAAQLPFHYTVKDVVSANLRNGVPILIVLSCIFRLRAIGPAFFRIRYRYGRSSHLLPFLLSYRKKLFDKPPADSHI